MISVMIVDDHPVVRNGLEAMLSVEEDMDVVAAVDGGAAALAWCQRHKKPPAVVSKANGCSPCTPPAACRCCNMPTTATCVSKCTGAIHLWLLPASTTISQ